MHLKNSIFHKIIPNCIAQGGDITEANGLGGESIYGNFFDDENFKYHHDPYVISMANGGKNTNASQFFFTFKKCPTLDGKHVVFGKIIAGKWKNFAFNFFPK